MHDVIVYTLSFSLISFSVLRVVLVYAVALIHLLAVQFYDNVLMLLIMILRLLLFEVLQFSKGSHY